MPEDEFRPLRDVAVEQVEATVQVVGVADGPHTGRSGAGTVASAHIIADLPDTEMGNEVRDQSGGAVPPVFVAAAIATVGVGDNGGQPIHVLSHILIAPFTGTAVRAIKGAGRAVPQ